MSAIFKRELKSYFLNPIGFVILGVFTCFSGIFFALIFSSGMPNVEYVVSTMAGILIYAIPFITMRLISEDRRQKVDQALLTAPVSVTGIVMGKFLAALTLYGAGFSITLLYQLIIAFYITTNWLVYLYALLGALLLGAAIISIGMFISSLTESPVVSAAITFGVILASMMISSYSSQITSPILQKVCTALAFVDRFYNFSSSTLNLADIVYMLSIAAVFVFLTVRSVEKRRWA